MQVRITDADGKPLPAGETGEIEAKGAAVMLGYWNNPKANAETLKDGWLRTGDVGRLDEDGFLTLSDRSKDVIISGGTNIYPREVEEALLTHADVREVSAIGVPDADWGEIVVACVVLEEGAAANDQTLDAHCLDLDRPLQAAEALRLSRRVAEEQLRQGAEDRTAQDDGEVERSASSPAKAGLIARCLYLALACWRRLTCATLGVWVPAFAGTTLRSSTHTPIPRQPLISPIPAVTRP